MARPPWHALPTIGLPRFTERVNRSHCADCGSPAAEMDGRPASRFSRLTHRALSAPEEGSRTALTESGYPPPPRRTTASLLESTHRPPRGSRQCRLVLQDAGLDAGDAVILGPRSRRDEPGDPGEGDPRERLARVGADEDVRDHRPAPP